MRRNSIGLCVLILLFPLLSRADWRSTFYTDESSYYTKLTSSGMIQRFRVDASDCSDIVSADVVLRKTSLRPVHFVRRSSTSWPVTYGQNAANFCWFEARVDGIDLNRAFENDYLIKIQSKTETLYYSGLTDSLLPKARLRTLEAAQKSWINLGPMGATAVEGGGVFFKIWEPIAERVDIFVASDTQALPMVATTSLGDNQRSHAVYVKDAKIGDSYFFKFVKKGVYENLEVGNNRLMSEWKVDPMARVIRADKKGGSVDGYVNPRGVIVNTSSYRWKNDDPSKLLSTDWLNAVIYQIWPQAYNPARTNGKYAAGTFKDVEGKLDYIADLGVDTVELLPVHEGRFNVSWGYALDSLVAIESLLGSPDELKHLVDALHGRGVRVIFDTVLNHVNNKLLREPLSATVQRTKFYDGGTQWGSKPDFANVMVRRWIADALLAVMREYHIDGFRFDMTPIVRSSPDGYRLLQELNILFKANAPTFYTSAEELPDDVWMTFPASQGGVGFDSQWNDQFKNFFEDRLSSYRSYNRWVNLGPLNMAMMGFSDQTNASTGDLYHFGAPSRTVNYLGSHDFIGNKNPILRIISDYTGVESVGAQSFYRIRPLEDPNNPRSQFRLIHNDFTHSVGRLCYGVLFTKPGSMLFYQGEEIAQDLNIQNEWDFMSPKENGSIPTKDVDVDRYVGSHRMPWEYYNPSESGVLSFLNDDERSLFAGYNTFFKDMIKFRRAHSRITENATVTALYRDSAIMAYRIKDSSSEFFVVANFGNAQDSMWIDFPRSSYGNWWKESINSSWKRYGGTSNRHSNIIPNLGGRKNMVRLAASSIVIFEAVDSLSPTQDIYFMSSLNNWEGSEGHRFKDEGSGLYSVDFSVVSGGAIEFKIATENWDVEMGDAGQHSSSTTGRLTYAPNAPNVSMNLPAGHYRLIYDSATFDYRVETLNP